MESNMKPNISLRPAKIEFKDMNLKVEPVQKHIRVKAGKKFNRYNISIQFRLSYFTAHSTLLFVPSIIVSFTKINIYFNRRISEMVENCF